MELASAVTINLNGQDVTITGFDTVFIDDVARKIVLVRLQPIMRPLILWRGAEYDAVGDWTQAQAEAKILELLGENPQETLQSFVVA
jgi:hypothetical protein